MKTIELLEVLREKALQTDGVNMYYNEDIYKAVDGNDIKYPVICMALQNMTVKENYVSYMFQFYGAERLENDEKNKSFALAQLFDIAEMYVAKLKQSTGILDVELDRQYNQSNFQTMDVVCCIYGTLTIDVKSEFSTC